MPAGTSPSGTGFQNRSFTPGCPRPSLSSAKHLPSPHSPSEFEPHCNLPVARVVRLSGDFAESGVSQERVGCPEAYRVGEIKELGSQFQFHSFPDREVLEETHVSIPYPLRSRVAGKPRCIARHLIIRNREAIAVVVACVRVTRKRHVVQAQTGPKI